MSNNINNEEVIKDDVILATADEKIDEILVEDVEEEIEEKKVKEIKVEEGNLFQKITATALDQAITLGCGALLLVVFDLIIRIVGFKVAQGYHANMVLIMFFIANTVYFPLISKFKDGRTIGKRIINII